MISVITPTHDPRYLGEAAESLRRQTYGDGFEWVLVPNGGAQIPTEFVEKAFLPIRVCPYTGEPNIGAIKRFACEQARGEIIVELDHDDLLMPNALQRVAETFEAGPDIGLVYSNFAEFRHGTWAPHEYNAAYGWQYRDAEYDGHAVREARTFPPTAHSLAAIIFAPNHLRAWRAREYWRVGGHDAEMLVADDHDLMCRLYLDSKVVHLDELLYLYRLHGDNSYLVLNKDVQEATRKVRAEYLERLALKWAALNGLQSLDICCGAKVRPGYLGVDRGAEQADVIADLDREWPFDSGVVGVIWASDALEHLRDPIHTMSEIWRVLAPGGFLFSRTPSTDGRGAWQDPTHRSCWNENSFWYWCKEKFHRFLPEECKRVRFQCLALQTYFPTQWHRQHQIPYAQAHLVALKPGFRPPGRLEV